MSTTTSPREFRWGIISTGWIASKFISDILVDPKTRDVHDVVHKVVAVASRTTDKAKAFVSEFISGEGGNGVKAYGTYEGVYQDADVDAVYVGTPHTQHYENTLSAIRAHKHVLCEKPITCNAAELESLITEAKAHGVFLMEAMWTRFQPLVRDVKELLGVEGDEGLGRPVVVMADLSTQFWPETLPKSHRIIDPDLGGGALLDLGPYPLVWAILSLYEHPANGLNAPTSITSTMTKFAPTGVDQNTTFVLTFSNPASSPPFTAQAVLHASMNLPDPSPAARIRCEHGAIEIDSPLPRSQGFTVKYYNRPGEGEAGKVKREVRREYRYDGSGWHFQADEVARCVWAGKGESELWGHEKSRVAMRVFDEVRRQGGYVLPPGVEKVV